MTSTHDVVPRTTADGLRGRPEFEAIGVDRIPEQDRTSTPWSFAGIFMGTSLSLALFIYGGLAIEFGLGIWSSLSSLAIGTLIGVLLIIPTIVIGSRTATNNSTASGAHFGVRGRLVGSFVGLAINLVYTALGIWSGGQVLVAILARLVGLPNTNLTLAIAYAVISVLVAGVAIYGYQLLLRTEFAIALLGAVTFVLILIGFVGRVDWSYHGGSYLLGSFAKTWIFAAVALGVSGPMSSIIFMGDWSRYISPEQHSTRRLSVVGSVTLFAGLMIPSILGVFIAAAFRHPLANFFPSLVSESPGWTAVAMLPLAIFGTVGFVVTNVYSSGLDLDAIVPRLSRAFATFIGVVGSTALVFLGSLVWNAQNSVTAASLLLVAIGTPWAAVTGIGYIRCRGRYHLDDLQVFNRRETGGRYWYRRGFNPGAVVAWLAGSVWGCLAIDASPIYKGPLSNLAGGVDTSFIGSFVLAAAVYLGYLGVKAVRRRRASPSPATGEAPQTGRQTPRPAAQQPKEVGAADVH